MASGAVTEEQYVTLLKQWRLAKYTKVFEEKDWDEVGIWKHLTDEILTGSLGFSVGAVHKFNFNYKKWCDENGIEDVDAAQEDDCKDDAPAPSNSAPHYNNLRLTGHWTDNRARFGAPARWTMDSNGLIRLHGVVELKNGHSDELVVVLPEAAYPGSFIYANRVDSRGVTVTVCVYKNGSSYGRAGDIKIRGSNGGKYTGAGTAYVSLNGITWYSAQ